VTIVSDTALDAIESAENFDLFVLPGGLQAAEAYAESSRVKQLIAEFHAQSKWIGIICACISAY
jgi:putative intracellular protease/amidase